ncbi:MAG: glycosyltransferase family 61 protein [Rhizomicrobium sp.]
MRVACVYDRDNEPVEASARLRGFGGRSAPEPDAITLREARRDNRSAYFLAINTLHYGHFLLEALCRAWAWEKQDAGRVAIIMSPPISNFARAFCELVPGLVQRLEVLQATTRFDNVTVASPAFVTACYAHAEFKAMCERMAERVVPSLEPMTEQPLYLSRAGLDPAKDRSILGEIRLERFLEAEGFHVARPETLPIREQIALFNRHKWIVTPLGSACHTRLFARRPINLLVLTGKMHRDSDQPFKTNFALCDLLSEGSAHYAKVFSVPDIGTGLSLEATSPVMVEEERLLDMLRGFGLIRARAEPGGLPPSLKDYKARWIEYATRRARRSATRKLVRTIAAVKATLHS